MIVEWNNEKNELLKKTRNVSFEQVADAIEKGNFIGPNENPARQGQKIIIVTFDGYPCVVPLVEMKNGGWFLKTIYQSRKYKKEGGK